jgi:hypothetical protein
MIYLPYRYYLFDNILFAIATQMSRQIPDVAGSEINWPPGLVRNIYGSGTLLNSTASPALIDD